MQQIIDVLAKEFSLSVTQVEKTVNLIDEGNTIPFIARYRKEVTGGLSDNVLRDCLLYTSTSRGKSYTIRGAGCFSMKR